MVFMLVLNIVLMLIVLAGLSTFMWRIGWKNVRYAKVHPTPQSAVLADAPLWEGVSSLATDTRARSDGAPQRARGDQHAGVVGG